MPNSPRNQAALDVEYTYRKRLFFGFDTDMVSRAYVDQTSLGVRPVQSESRILLEERQGKW
jgi:hypothetical protein